VRRELGTGPDEGPDRTWSTRRRSGVHDEDVLLPDQESEQLDPAGRLDRRDPRRKEQAEAIDGDPAELVVTVGAAETHDRWRRAT